MALISVAEVQAASPLVANFSHQYGRKSAAALQEQRRTTPLTATFDIFLSHSYTDADLILDLKSFLENFDLSVYVDWLEDEQLDRSRVTPATAKVLRRRMNQCRCLLFATTGRCNIFAL